MSAVFKPEVRLEPLTEALLDDVLRIENSAYAHPWTRGNFAGSLKSGYQLLALMGGNTLVGYWVAMEGVDEVHLLNITVSPEFQGQGYGVLMLDALSVWARSRQAQWLWLEVRVGNTHAMQVYERYGFRPVGERKNYYSADQGQREHAVVMSFKL
ncbi:ribosomal protein S18-alanine N-acetyltransferase [Limnohabitans sp.]|uniref:ribosomal protein S18-alanine N-acetyltransferase n=1 Tax=Limnohabitans sp. TaxID=1907725 RepID=UPI00286F2B45|nr:ribosomal protein S18-alanine N-acetyltransferase [Limnohabitans sp.]